jgi:hypothetical protein
LSHINEFSDPLEATFVNVKHRALSFAAFILLEDERMSIIRGFAPQTPIPLPEAMAEGPGTIVYTFKKSAADETVTEKGRTPLKVRLIDMANDPKVLVDVTIRPLIGGKLRYSSE